MTRPIALLPLWLQSQDSAAREAVHGASLPFFEKAVLIHLDAAYTLARYLTRRSDIAEDIVQEAMLRALVSFDKQRGESARSWLLAIVRNCFLTWYARDRKHSAISDIDNLFQLNVKPAL
jgi:RNA polymerase sigma factor (sigma-70 family)